MAATTRTRREWLVGSAAAAVALLLRADAFAAPFESVPGYGSKDEFRKECLGYKGATFDVGQYSTACAYPDGDVKVCDENGKNCTYHEAEDGPPSRPYADPFDDGSPLPVITAVTSDGGGAPAAAEPESKPGKRGKKGGKRRKR